MTIKDIAKESGYAISTVSRALNNKSDVSAEARMKIQAIVKSHEFVPNNHAKQLKQQQTTSISIIVKGSFNMFFASIVEQLQNYISKSGYSTIIHYLGEIVDEVKMAQRLILENKPLGIIFLGGNVDSFKKEFSGINIPCVLATTYSPDLDFTNLSMVGIDDISAGEKAITYLIKKGHTKIGIIGGDRDVSFISNMRFKGCLKGLIYGGKSFDDSYYQTAKFSYSSAYKAMNTLLSRKKDITAVFCMSDVMAIGVMRAVSDAGLRVPEDISVVGFDGIELSKFYNPKLTTIVQPQKLIAEKSAELMISSIEGKISVPQRMVVDVTLFEGESVATRSEK